MSIICQQSPYYLLFAKGSPEAILDRSTHTLVKDRYAELTEIDQLKIRSQNAQLASQGLRVWVIETIMGDSGDDSIAIGGSLHCSIALA